MFTQSRVWRSLSNGGHNGFFVWEVMEAKGEPAFWPSTTYLATTDNGLITVMCYHFFTKVEAEKFFNANDFPEFNTVIHV